MQTNNSDRIIKEAIRKIALGRSADRVAMSPSGVGGVGTTRMIHGYVAKINDDPADEYCGTIDVGEYPDETASSELIIHRGVLLAGTQDNSGGFLVIPTLFSDVTIVSDAATKNSYVVNFSHADFIQLRSHKSVTVGVVETEDVDPADENVPRFIRFSSAATNDHILLKDVDIPTGSVIVFDKGYVDYRAYERFSQQNITYVTKLKRNAIYEGIDEIDIPDEADTGIIKDEVIVISKRATKELPAIEHNARRIAYWDDEKGKLIEFLTNNVDIKAEEIVEIYKRRWQIETLFKQLKQNFQLRYFYGDSVNAIERPLQGGDILKITHRTLQSHTLGMLLSEPYTPSSKSHPPINTL